MSVLLLQIGCFALIPLGAYLLVRTIKFGKSFFFGEVLLELPFAMQQGAFTVTKAGVYAIWQKGELFKRTPVDQFKSVVYDDSANQQVTLYPSFMRLRMNDGSMSRMELATFSAEPGRYRLELQAGSSFSGLEKAASSLFASLPTNTSNYAIQVRQSQPFYYKLLMIPLLLAALQLMINGLTWGLQADQLAPTLFK